MEEEVGVKVTRMRRRLSIEAEDIKSPSTQSTPTKKRGGKLAAKPQLELIDENATEADKPKRTRKSVGREAAPEEKAVTPSRRSTRIRSNTSIVSEAPAETENKGTPSKRSSRIKSNTSIVAEAAQHVDSPRAKRAAARRTSQISSDNEAPVTPGRSTRRTRKDSTSSIDKQVELNPVILETQVKGVIPDEAKSNAEDSKNKKTPTTDRKESTTSRKNPSLNEKFSSPDTNNKENEMVNEFKDEKSDTTNDSNISSSKGIYNKKGPEEINLSISTSDLINQLNHEPKKGYDNLNKTTSAVEETQSKSKRHRTKSWTTITLSPTNDNNFLSDTEAIIKKKKKNRNESGSGDNELNTSKETDRKMEEHDMKDVSLNCSSTSDKTKKNRTDKSIIDAETPVKAVPIANNLAELDKLTTDKKKLSTEITSTHKEDPNFTEKFFGKDPTGAIQSIVYIEDDSNAGSGEKENVIKDIDSGDQCVPVVEHHLEDQISKEDKNNLSYEPMDIDETIPENISLAVFTDDKTIAPQNTDPQIRKSFPNISQTNNVSIDSTSAPQRISIISNLGDDEEIVSSKSKRKSVMAVTSSDDTIDKNTRKSLRKSSLSIVNVDDNTGANSSMPENNINDSSNKFKRKSSISISTGDETNSSNSNLDDNNMNKSTNIHPDNSTYEGSNKSNRKSSISSVAGDSIINKSKIIHDIPNAVHMNSVNIDNNDSIIKCSDKPQRTSIAGIRKSSGSNADSDGVGDLVKKSKRKSTLSKEDSDDKVDKDSTIKRSFNKSDRMSNASYIVPEDDVSDNVNKSNVNDENDAINKSSKKTRKISLGVLNDTVPKNTDKSNMDNDEVNKSFIESDSVDITNQSSDKSKRKSLISNNSNNDNIHNASKSKKEEITDNCKRVSSISNVDVEESFKSELNNNREKSKRKYSISQMDSHIFDKSNSKNKTTSQILNISETTLLKDVNVSHNSKEQLTKSINMPNILKDKESNTKNLSLTYSTSTPLQQKPLKKLGMHMNSSMITPNSVTKIESKKYLNISKNETSIIQNEEASLPSDEENEESSDDNDDVNSDDDEENSYDDDEEGSEDDTMDSSKMIENEADEASDDYESGDSRDEDARKYEQEHEIVEKGDTLDSEDENFSDDSEYEKGSFIVDSDDEDADLLSGSGDDLSMSADELNMSAKSKKKFNERKIKEQKKASREMFEARHKLNKSDSSVKSERPKSKTKVNRQRLESSESESEEDVGILPRKNRRARIDSSQDISMTLSDTDKSTLNQKKKLAKRSLSRTSQTESSKEKKSSNEIEISIHENLEIQKEKDPLSLQNIVKEEPKTPQKDFNLSTVPIFNVEVEKVDIESNVSIMRSNQTTDPLQLTMTQDEVMVDDSEESISENEEITQNYESVLNDLNKKSSKVKSIDLSLNLIKKTKQKAKEPIIDQLNLTQVKKSKKKKKNSSEKTDSKRLEKDKSLINKIMEKDKSVNNQDEGSSDSIDMKLLFNEDSTDGESKFSTDKGNKKVVEDFIPLKKTEGKTNILENNDDDKNGLNFFIDTTGTHDDVNKSLNNTSIKGSTKKNKHKNNVSENNIGDANNDDDTNDDAPKEISYNSDKKNDKSKQNSNISQTRQKNIAPTDSKSPTSAKKDKKKKKSLDNTHFGVEHAEEKASSPAKITLDVSIGSAEKQKQKTVREGSNIEKEIVIKEVNIDMTEEETSKKRKRKPSFDQSIEETTTKVDVNALNASKITSNQKKKRKISHSSKNENTETKKTDAVSQNKKHEEERFSDEHKPKGKNVPEHKDVQNDESTKKSKKRKERDDDSGEKLSKVVKQNYFDEVHVPRLPTNVLRQLDDKPKKYESKQQIISTTSFKVEETRKKRSKPSNYLEQSVYLNDSIEEQTKKQTVKTPKVLPFIPTASTSDCGFTTKFRVNVIPQLQQFVAQSEDISNFKNDYLQKNRIKKLGTFEKYKRHRNVKISKF